MHETAFFRHITQIPATWEEGTVPLPTFYHDVMAIHADFLASSESVRSILPSSRMHPFRVAPRRCVLSLAALSYRESDLGRYDELLVGVPFTLDEPSPQFMGTLRSLPDTPMIYVHRLPVTTEAARKPGIRFLSAPKFMADIAFEETEQWVRCYLAEGGSRILTLEVRKSDPEPTGRWSVNMITAKDGYLLRWQFTESEQRRGVSRDGSDARLDLGSHPMARELRELKPGRLLSCEYRPRFQAVLGPVVESFRAEPEGNV